MSYQVGDAVTLSVTWRTAAGVTVDASTILTVTDPDGVVTTPPPAHVGEAGSGQYSVTFVVDKPGTWLYRWTASDAITATEYDQITVSSQRVLIASLAELRAHLNNTRSADDDELRTYLAASTDAVEKIIGGPVGPTTYTERLTARGGVLIPYRTPVVSITSIATVSSGVSGTALLASAYGADDITGIIRLHSGGSGTYDVVYRAGYTVLPWAIRMAGLIIADQLWETQRPTGRPGAVDDMLSANPAYAIPNRALELLRPYILPAVA